jgi:protein-tyrosine-phosphatase
MAEVIAHGIAHERGLADIEFGSAGTAAWEGAPASDGAMLVCLERQTDLSTHHARLVTPDLLQQYDLVLAMGPYHVERLEALGARGKAHLITTYASRGASDRPIGDPFGGELDLYRETFEELHRELRLVLERIAAERTPGVS